MKILLFLITAIIIVFIGYKFSKPKKIKMIDGQTLNYIEIKPLNKQTPKKLVLILHGYGTNRNDLIHLASDFSDLLPQAQFISVDAPEPFEGGYEDSYQWFSLQTLNYFFIKPKIEVARKILDKFIDEQLKRFGLKDEDLILIGFSQGGMMSLYTGLQRENKLMGVISFSGALAFDDSTLKKRLKSKPRMLLVHGTSDERMPYSYFEDAKKMLTKADIPFEEYSVSGMEHTINSDAIERAREFVKSLD